MMARALIALLWLLHWLPLPVQAAIGWGLGRVLWWLARSRRHVTRVNLRLCFPDWTEARREALAKEHFGWLARSLLERGMLWFASGPRLKRLVQVEGDIGQADRDPRPMMWLLPHFVALEFVGPALTMRQSRRVVDVYSRQSNPVFDAQLHAGRMRFGNPVLVDRRDGVRPVLRAIQAGAGFCNAPDMDFGRRDSAFVPFFGVPTSTLLAPARMVRSMGMQVQMLVVTILPRGRGYLVRCMAPPEGFNDPDPVAAAAAFNRWLEQRVRENPAQYWWVHRRFKTRPEGEPPVYD